MDTDLIARVFLSTFMLMLMVVYSAKQAAHIARDRSAPIYYGSGGSEQRRIRQVFNIARSAILSLCVARVFFPNIDAYAGPLPALESDTLRAAGAALLLLGAWRAFYAHTYMGALWRSGLPSPSAYGDMPDALLQRGPFARSRNPIFVGVHMTQLGLFAIWPCLFTLACLVIGMVALDRQRRLEEVSLTARFGASYTAYRARTPRWLGL